MTSKTIGSALESAAHGLARQVLGRRRLPLRELRNKIVLGRSAMALRRLEDGEVERLAPQVTLPQAKVAVVTATYRRPELLVSSVRSALAQTVRDIVVIVVDDGGGLPALPDDPRLQACSLSGNTAVLGVVLNVGIRLTHSEYVAFLDDDNEWEPEHLEVAIAALEARQPGGRPGLVYTALRRSLPDGQLMDVLSTPFDRRLLAREAFVDTNSLVIRRFPQLHFSRIRRPIGVRPREDWELVYRLSRRMATQHVPIPTVRYNVNPESYYTDWTETFGAMSARRDLTFGRGRLILTAIGIARSAYEVGLPPQGRAIRHDLADPDWANARPTTAPESGRAVQWLPPRHGCRVPLHRGPQALGERNARRVAQTSQHRVVQRVAAVVPLPVLDRRHHVPADPAGVEDGRRQLPIGQLHVAIDMVDPARFAGLEHELDTPAVIVHVNPAADVKPSP